MPLPVMLTTPIWTHSHVNLWARLGVTRRSLQMVPGLQRRVPPRLGFLGSLGHPAILWPTHTHAEGTQRGAGEKRSGLVHCARLAVSFVCFPHRELAIRRWAGTARGPLIGAGKRARDEPQCKTRQPPGATWDTEIRFGVPRGASKGTIQLQKAATGSGSGKTRWPKDMPLEQSAPEVLTRAMRWGRGDHRIQQHGDNNARPGSEPGRCVGWGSRPTFTRRKSMIDVQ